MEVFNLFVDDLTVLDCAILDPQRGPIGMSWAVGVEFIGGLTKEGVVFDFSYAKKCAKKVIDSTADHAFIIPSSVIASRKPQRTVNVDKDQGYTAPAEIRVETETLTYEAPEQAFFIVSQVTESTIIAELERLIFDACKQNKECAALKAVKLTFTNEKVAKPNAAYYCYTHGLKDHYGNCQRLIHGHQSTIEVFVDGMKRPDLEQEVAYFYYDKHFAFKENIKNSNFTDRVFDIEYKSGQGNFLAKIPKEKIVLYPYETTVENISKFTAHWLKHQFCQLGQHTVVVKAYEGIGKGCTYVLPPQADPSKLLIVE